ncbi:DUF6380 family protein [Streptomyces sp. MS06]
MEQPVHADAGCGERRATLRWRAASLTETVGCARCTDHDRRTGEGAR